MNACDEFQCEGRISYAGSSGVVADRACETVIGMAYFRGRGLGLGFGLQAIFASLDGDVFYDAVVELAAHGGHAAGAIADAFDPGDLPGSALLEL